MLPTNIRSLRAFPIYESGKLLNKVKNGIKEEDFYLIDFAQKDEFRSFEIDVPPRGLTVLTESGYLMLVKSFTDDLAWEVQRKLVKGYFRQPEANEQPANPQSLPEALRSSVTMQEYRRPAHGRKRRIFENFPRYSGICANVPEYSGIFPNLLEYSGISGIEHLVGHKMCHNKP